MGEPELLTSYLVEVPNLDLIVQILSFTEGILWTATGSLKLSA